VNFVVINKNVYECDYFWYLIRCLLHMQAVGWIGLKVVGEVVSASKYVTVLYFDDQPIIIDTRDDFHLPGDAIEKFPKALIFKSNFSQELWESPPELFEERPTELELQHYKKLKPWIHGRAMCIPYDMDEFAAFTHPLRRPVHKVASFSGEGVFKLQTEARLKVFDLVRKVYPNSPLVWRRRPEHFRDAAAILDYLQRISPYMVECRDLMNFRNYCEFLSGAEYSLNTPGISMSQPFRCVDAVLAGSAIISTKIWTDVYKDFPCVMLPVCGYTGLGDWVGAENILRNLNNHSRNELVFRGKEWYNKYLSAEGMYYNQICKNIEV